jgi:hypothetical protein
LKADDGDDDDDEDEVLGKTIECAAGIVDARQS